MKREFNYCLRCHRKLKDVDARIRGYGKVCWEKRSENKNNLSPLFTNNRADDIINLSEGDADGKQGRKDTCT